MRVEKRGELEEMSSGWIFRIMAERVGFEPTVEFPPTHAFQACSIDHSDISPFRINELRAVLSSLSQNAPSNTPVRRCDLYSAVCGRVDSERSRNCVRPRNVPRSLTTISLSCFASELFGHEKGAFTGAVQQRRGRFELAHSGTIFLDEIGEIPIDTQISLLRVLQERQFERVGGSRAIPVDVRVIAATNRDLPEAIAAGTFGSDLFYRLNVFPIVVPPLRKRREDIPILVEYFVKRFAEKMAKRIRRIDKHTLELCERYSWPGNIRELQDIVSGPSSCAAAIRFRSTRPGCRARCHSALRGQVRFPLHCRIKRRT